VPGQLLGNLAGGPVPPFTGSTSHGGSVQDLDGDTDLDIRCDAGLDVHLELLFSPDPTRRPPVTPVDANSGEVRVAGLNFSLTGNVGDTFINFVRRTNSAGGNIATAAVWVQDGAPKNPPLGAVRQREPGARAHPRAGDDGGGGGAGEHRLLARRRSGRPSGKGQDNVMTRGGHTVAAANDRVRRPGGRRRAWAGPATRRDAGLMLDLRAVAVNGVPISAAGRTARRSTSAAPVIPSR
jgi:hypothetical protein